MAMPMRVWTLAVGLAALLLSAPGARGQLFGHGHAVGDRLGEWAGLESDAPPTTVRDVACLIDCLDKKLYGYGKVAVQSPSVFGQNRMTGYRADYEEQMKGQLGKFEVILSGYQRRADSAALASSTSVAAAIRPEGAAAALPHAAAPATGGTSSTTVVVPQGSSSGAPSSSDVSKIAIPSISTPPGYVNANTLIGTAGPDLTTDALANVALANSGSPKGIGLDPNQALDEQSDYLNHLNELRRINAGDDASDLPGYGLYLVRIPIALLPSRESGHGKGASVTFKAKHNVTPDALPNTFASVVILDTTYSLLDTVVRGQFFRIVEPGTPTSAAGKLPSPLDKQRLTAMAVPTGLGTAGSTHGASGNAPSTEVVQLFGAENLMVLVEALHSDQATWYRHDPSVASWLLGELASAYGYMREQAHRQDPLFQRDVFEDVARLVLERRYTELKTYRDNWITSLRKARGVYTDPATDKPEPIDVLSFALIVQSAFLDRQIKYDMEVFAQRKGCACGDPRALSFYDLYPTAPEDVARYNAARAAFAAYVECKWPIHIFAVDPAVDQQNELDLFSQRTQLQLALAVAIASGSVNFQNATSYARRLDMDLETIALNRTAIGFGAGDTTFGWQFYPRIQTPPTQSNPARIAGILINNGPGLEYALKTARIEPGPRECYALVVMPNFVPSIKMTSVTNWFDLKTKHPEQVLDTADMVRLGKKLQAAKHGLQHVCDTSRYRPEEVELLADRIAQLEDMLPVKGHTIALPFEGSLLGSEIFSSNAAGLAPRLLAWYGEPPQEGADSSIFVLGNGFCVNELHVIAGGLNLPPANLDVISRNVLRVTIPAGARPVKTTLKVDGVDRKLLDVHVASPNGISNHLLVEIQPAAAVQAAPPPPSGGGGFSLSSKTSTVDASYAPLPRADGKGSYPVYLGVAANAEVDLAWDSTIGIGPGSVDAAFEFPDPRGDGFATLGVTLKAIPGDGGSYAIKGPALDTLAGSLLSALAAQGLPASDKPTVALKSSKITLTPNPAAGLAVKAEPVSGPLTVNLNPMNVIARVDPQAVKVMLNIDLSKITVDQDVAIDWLGGVPRVKAKAAIELSSAGAAAGTIEFADGEIVHSGGKRVIKKEVIARRLGQLLAQPGATKPKGGDVYQARLFSVVGSIDGVALAPTFVTNPFELDILAPQAAGAYVAPRAGFPTARRVAPPAAAPRAAPVRRDEALRRTSADLPPLPASGESKPAPRQSLIRRLMPGSR